MHILIPPGVARSAPVSKPVRSASLHACLSSSAAHVRDAQSLRRRVFFDEMGARATDRPGGSGELDVDRFDDFCEHLLIKARRSIDPVDDEVVGTYRVLSP